MRQLAINSGDAFILVCSVDKPNSFEDLKQLRQSILEERERAYLEASISSSCSSSLCSSTNLAELGPEPSSRPSLTADGRDCQPTSASNHNNKVTDHWSLASLFGHLNHNHHHQQQHQLQQQRHQNQNQQQQANVNYANETANQHFTSSSSLSFSTSSSSVDSRRSSISAAEAALKTRRTRRPPMVIVANKCDLPEEQHKVNCDEIEALALIDWNNGFVRASAAFNSNINDIFQQVLKQAKQPPTLTEAIVSKRRRSLPPKLSTNSIVQPIAAGQQF